MPTQQSNGGRGHDQNQQFTHSAPQWLAPPVYAPKKPKTTEAPTGQFLILDAQSKIQCEMTGWEWWAGGHHNKRGGWFKHMNWQYNISKEQVWHHSEPNKQEHRGANGSKEVWLWDTNSKKRYEDLKISSSSPKKDDRQYQSRSNGSRRQWRQ